MYVFFPLPPHIARLMPNSDALHLFCHLYTPVRYPPGSCVLSSMDLRRLRQRELLLRNHVGVEPCSYGPCLGRYLCRAAGRVGDREAGDEGEGDCANLRGEGLLWQGIFGWDWMGRDSL